MVRQPVRAAERCERVAQCLQAPFAGPAATVPMVREASGAASLARRAQSFHGRALSSRSALRRSALVRSARPERGDSEESD